VGGAADPGLVVPNRDQRQAPTECDRLALPVDHPERPASIAGVNFDVIDGQRAVDACQATVRAVHRPRHLTALGLASLRQRNLQDGFDNLVRAAIQEDAAAMLFLGLLFETTALGPIDRPKARDWFEQAAARGNAPAMVALAASLRNIQAGPVDEAAARLWLQRGARLGNAQAMTDLGLMLRDGLGGPASSADAVAWFTRGGQFGNAQALAELGTMYERGLGVAMDATRGLQFHREAASALATAYRAGEWSARRAMDQELAGWPDAVRFEVQRMLQAGGLYRGPINGRITQEIRTAFDSWSATTATR
jgi:TPR repeat protein